MICRASVSERRIKKGNPANRMWGSLNSMYDIFLRKFINVMLKKKQETAFNMLPNHSCHANWLGCITWNIAFYLERPPWQNLTSYNYQAYNRIQKRNILASGFDSGMLVVKLCQYENVPLIHWGSCVNIQNTCNVGNICSVSMYKVIWLPSWGQLGLTRLVWRTNCILILNVFFFWNVVIPCTSANG